VLRIRYQVLLIATLVLAAFYPAMHSGYNIVDDLDLLKSFEDFQGWTFRGVFLPGSGEALYYRPLLYLTSVFDYTAWSLHSNVMHLENVLIHLCNSFFVYFLAREIISPDQRTESWIPFVSASLFGLHPISVESVCWISGRTDLLAGFFLFPAALFAIRYKQNHRKKYLLCSTVAAILAFLSKESSLGFVMGALFLGIARTSVPSGATAPSRRRHILQGMVVFSAIAGGVALFFVLRLKAFSSNGSGIYLTLQSMENNPLYSVMLVLRTFAFYLKKVFWPFPLNFAIVEVDPLYELAAIPLVLLTCWIALRRTIVSALFMTGVGLMAPAFLIAFGQVAWTPFAERYVYLSLGFILTGVVHVLGRHAEGFWTAAAPVDGKGASGGTAPIARPAVGILVILVLLGAFGATMHRASIWSSNLTLYEDVARKTPDFQTARNLYGVALTREGRTRDALREFDAARSLYAFRYEEKYDINYGVMLVSTGEYDKALALFRSVVDKTKGKSVRAREGMLSVYLKQLSDAPQGEKREQLSRSIRNVAAGMYTLNPEPDLLYFMGMASIASGDRERAGLYFRTAHEKARQGSFVRELAAIKLRHLGTGGT